MNKEMLDIVNDLSKKPTTELALQIMELSSENLILEQQCKKQKEVINKAVEYIKNKGGYCEEYKMTSRPFNTIELDNLLQILEDKEVSE